MKFVVSRYKENVDWTNGIDDCIIYNKGPDTFESKHPIIVLPNVGREGHTYLHHIITNYDNLDDYTCFLQGYPFDHTPYLESILIDFQNRVYKKSEVIPYHIISKKINHISLAFDPMDAIDGPPMYRRVYKQIFQKEKTDHQFLYGAGAQFIVSKAAILSRSKEFYENEISKIYYEK